MSTCKYLINFSSLNLDVSRTQTADHANGYVNTDVRIHITTTDTTRVSNSFGKLKKKTFHFNPSSLKELPFEVLLIIYHRKLEIMI